MDVETSYKFDGDAQVSDVAAFLRERHVESGWGIDGEPTNVGGYRYGNLRVDFTESFEPDEED